MCVFCEIAQGLAPAHIVWEDECCAAFLDSDPVCEGHVLLIPRAHYTEPEQMPEDVYMHMMLAARRLISALCRAMKADGVSMMLNGGRFNDIGHCHLHLIPRRKGDGFGWTDACASPPCDASVAAAIRKAL